MISGLYPEPAVSGLEKDPKFAFQARFQVKETLEGLWSTCWQLKKGATHSTGIYLILPLRWAMYRCWDKATERDVECVLLAGKVSAKQMVA